MQLSVVFVVQLYHEVFKQFYCCLCAFEKLGQLKPVVVYDGIGRFSSPTTVPRQLSISALLQHQTLGNCFVAFDMQNTIRQLRVYNCRLELSNLLSYCLAKLLFFTCKKVCIYIGKLKGWKVLMASLIVFSKCFITRAFCIHTVILALLLQNYHLFRDFRILLDSSCL